MARIIETSAVYTSPPEGFISPMLWGTDDHVTERFGSAGVAKENISFSKQTFTFNAVYPPSEFVNVFKNYYAPIMNASGAAAKTGEALDLQHKLEALSPARIKTPSQLRRLCPPLFR